ncbi:MAG: hypothetical protein AAGA75_20945 [Cyanobacteria bacterium P01_E01_bin.6]
MSNTGVHGHSIYSVIHRLSTTAVVSGLFVGLMPVLASASALQKNAYEACTRSLLGDGITIEDASSACASALEPRDISTCVDRISGGTDISATDALDSCIQVRRPKDMASCVVRIEGGVDAAIPLDVMDNCTRSLLPDEYSDCVVGLDSATDLSAADLLNTCIAADYRLPSVSSNFQPAGSSSE